MVAALASDSFAIGSSPSVSSREDADEELPAASPLSPCCAGLHARLRGWWPVFWSLIFLGSLAEGLVALNTLDLAVAYFSGGTDPCASGPSHDKRACDEAVARAKEVHTLVDIIKSVSGVLLSPVVGVLCDVYGRKPFIIFYEVTVLIYVLSLGAVFWLGAPVYWIYAAKVVDGLVNSSLVFQLWLIDSLPEQQRAAFMAIVYVLCDFEWVVVPVLGGLASRAVLAALALACGIIVVVLAACLPESLPRGERLRGPGPLLRDGRSHQAGRAFSLRAITRLFRSPASRLVVFLYVSATARSSAIQYAFLKLRLGIDYKAYSQITLPSTVANWLAQLCLLGVLQRILGLRGLCAAGFACALAGDVAYFTVLSKEWAALAGVLLNLAAVAKPAVAALFLSIPAPHERGHMQGAVTSVLSVWGTVQSAGYNALFAVFATRGPEVLTGLPFLTDGMLYFISIIALACTRHTCLVHPSGELELPRPAGDEGMTEESLVDAEGPEPTRLSI
mmetsp:Transcript_178486/g.566329  ORF Transcript_178486/g.566329 Transcript_178486/m.566329 type:complete len:504 (+) Transcript_178486:47-1558(+)